MRTFSTLYAASRRPYAVVDGRDKSLNTRFALLPGHDVLENYEHPVVEPQVSHFMQVPLRTSVKLPHSPQASPS
jgi:hypothetical protein